MAIVFQDEGDCSCLIIWQIKESEEQLCRMVDAEEAAYSKTFKSEQRRCEWLAWRMAVRSRLPHVRIEYNEVGAPVLVGDSECFSYVGVTHTSGYAIVMLSDTPCAIDAEHAGRNFMTAAERFISDAESCLKEVDNPLFGAMIWCSKEVLYKMAGEREIDFLEDIQVTETDIEAGDVYGKIRTKAGWRQCRLRTQLYADIIIIHNSTPLI